MSDTGGFQIKPIRGPVVCVANLEALRNGLEELAEKARMDSDYYTRHDDLYEAIYHSGLEAAFAVASVRIRELERKAR